MIFFFNDFFFVTVKIWHQCGLWVKISDLRLAYGERHDRFHSSQGERNTDFADEGRICTETC